MTKQQEIQEGRVRGHLGMTVHPPDKGSGRFLKTAPDKFPKRD